MPETKRPLKVFLCHASADKQKVRELYRYLRRRGIRPWFDEMDLVGGQDWQIEIPKALSTSDAIIICLSRNSVDKEGYIQKEIKFALDRALEMPEGRIFLIPVKFEECEVPYAISRYQWVDLFDEAGYARMMRSLKFRASQLERATVEVFKKDVKAEKLALEKAAREKAEQEKQEQAAREQLESEAAERAKREKEREAHLKAIRNQAKREAAEEARRERAKRLTTQITSLKEAFSKSSNSFKLAIPKVMTFIRIGGIIGIALILFWVGSWAMPQILSMMPTARANSTSEPIATRASPNTVDASATPAKTRTPTTSSIATRMPTATSYTGSLSTEFTDAQGVDMLLVPAGDFIMGSNARDDEKPPHEIYVDAFYMDKYEVTNFHYKLCVDADICQSPKQEQTTVHSSYYGNSEFDNYPVVYVDWNQAKIYCEWRGGSLPTEAQWEKAARGTTGRTYPWGEGIDCNRANHFNYGCVDFGKGTTEVGTYRSGTSPYGIYDLAGNVLEWVGDWYLETYYRSSPSSNPKGPATGDYRVLRGGSWGDFPEHLPASYRFKYFPDFTSDFIGFRCVHPVP